MKNDQYWFTVVNEKGEEVECEVLFSFDSKETGKSYIAYTDHSIDNEGNTRVFASTYDPNDDQRRLCPIETEREWAKIQIVLEEIQAAINSSE